MRISFAVLAIFLLLEFGTSFAEEPKKAAIPDFLQSLKAGEWKQVSIESLRQKQLQVAKRWVISVSVSLGGSWREWEEKYPAHFAERDTKLKSAKTKTERLVALQWHIDSIDTAFRQKIDVLHRSNSQMGEPHRLGQAEYYLADAKIAYLDEEGNKTRIEKEKEALSRDRLIAAEKWNKGDQTSRKFPLPDTSIESSHALAVAKLALAKTKQERLAVLKEDVDRIQSIFDKIYALYNTNSSGGEPKVLERTRYYLCDAKIRYTVEEGNDLTKSLRDEKLKAAEAWLEAIQTQLSSTNRSESFAPLLATRGAKLDLVSSRNDRLQILQKSIDELQSIRDGIEALYKSNSKGGESWLMAEACYHLLDAEIQYKLEEAKK